MKLYLCYNNVHTLLIPIYLVIVIHLLNNGIDDQQNTQKTPKNVYEKSKKEITKTMSLLCNFI